MENNSFCLKVVFFFTKFFENCYFSKFYVLLFLLYLGQFLRYFCLFYHFEILKVLSYVWFEHVILSQCYKNTDSFFLHKTLCSDIVGIRITPSPLPAYVVHGCPLNISKRWMLYFIWPISLISQIILGICILSVSGIVLRTKL